MSLTTIITCPACKRQFNLKHKAPRIFTCPKCSFTTSFTSVLGGAQAPNNDKVPTSDGLPTQPNGYGPVPSPIQTLPGGTGDSTIVDPSLLGGKTEIVAGLGGGKTKVVAGLGGGGGKTEVIESLQPKKFGFKMVFKGSYPVTITLPTQGQFTLGRKSSDSTANIKLSPDMAMSRVHAGMRVIMLPGGGRGFQITSAKDANPVYVNGMPIAKGQAVNLKAGDKIRLGETELVFGRY